MSTFIAVAAIIAFIVVFRKWRALAALARIAEGEKPAVVHTASTVKGRAGFIIAEKRPKRLYYQFQIDNRAFGSRIRERWVDAAADAVASGHATWVGAGRIAMDDQGSIEKVYR